jgi:hypothetical protein
VLARTERSRRAVNVVLIDANAASRELCWFRKICGGSFRKICGSQKGAQQSMMTAAMALRKPHSEELLSAGAA